MLVYAVAFGLLVHGFYWGAGLALCLMPRRWRQFWPAFAFPAGFALQSLVVWCGAYAGLKGTQSYAIPCEVIPILLLIAGVRRGSGGPPLSGREKRRAAASASDLFRWRAVYLLSAAVLAALAYPLTQAAKGLTTASLGSCDAADYAAGARVLQSFAHSDRGGFLGLTEVVHIMSVDNFFDFWLKLNHFTPSALLAFNGTIFHCQPHELTSLMPMVILAASIPAVFWIARALFGFSTGGSLFVAALYGFSPVSWYAVYQVAIGQLVAAPAIALLTWAGVALWRGRLDSRRGREFFGVLALGYSLIWGGYNFMVIACWVPAAAYVGWSALATKRIGRLGPWLAWMLAPLIASGALFWTRVSGLLDRFRLFQNYDFGWHISALSPEGWLGVVHGTGDLRPWSGAFRLVMLGAAVVLTGLAGWRAARRRRRSALLAAAVAVPILLGYAYLLARGAYLGTNASYDAFKLFSVFYPVLLPAFAYWLTLWEIGSNARVIVGLFAAAIVAAVAVADSQLIRVMSAPDLIVDRDLIGVQRLESNPAVQSVNLRLPVMWDRLWANAFLLRRPQYFETHTYEGRLNTPLRGDWDLTGGLIAVGLPLGDSIAVDPHYTALRTGSRYYLRAALGSGWFPPERMPRTTTVWRWTGDEAQIAITNPHPFPLTAAVRVDATSLIPRQLELWNAGVRVGSAACGPVRTLLTPATLSLPPGDSIWSIRPDHPATRPSPGDDRRLAFSIFSVRLDVRPSNP